MTKEFALLFNKYLAVSRLSQSEAARRSGLTGGHINRVASGKRSLGAESAEVLATVLGVPDRELAEFLLLAAGYTRELVQEALSGENEVKKVIG